MSMARTCSKCGNKGHNSRTCWSTTQYYWTQQLDKPKERRSGNSSLRLFGVQLDHHVLSSSSSSSSVSVISRNVIKRKRPIMDYCNSWSSSSPHLTSCLSGYRANIGINRHDQISRINNGGLQETNYNKGVGWSEEEHRKFLEGIETLGKGDWRGISKHYVTTRSPTQVASHAQKYFLRLQNSTTANTATINNLDFNFDPHKKRCRVRPSLSDVSKDQLVSPRQLIDINTDNPNTEASVNNPYECWPAVHYSTPLRIDVNLKNSSSQSAAAAAAGGGLDLELKLAVSIMPLGLDQ